MGQNCGQLMRKLLPCFWRLRQVRYRARTLSNGSRSESSSNRNPLHRGHRNVQARVVGHTQPNQGLQAATVEDTWSVVGMCGTGSHNFHLEEVFVPTAQTSSFAEPPRNRACCTIRACSDGGLLGHGGQCLGYCPVAIEQFLALATCTSSTVSPILLRDRPFVQTRVAEADAILSAARAHVVEAEAVGTAREAVGAGVSDPSRVIARARLAMTHGIHEAVRAVDLVFHAAGTHAIYRTHLLERAFRDIHVAVQHNAAFPAHYESAGKVFLGLRPSDMGW